MTAILSLALIPVVFLLGYIFYKDRVQPEPVGNLVKGVLYGVLSCFVSLGLGIFTPEFDAGNPVGAFLNAFFSAAIPEECAKLLMLWLLVRHMPEFDEPFDGIVYATCVGMGFAGLENILYLFGEEDFVSVGVMRGLFAVPGHFFFAVAMGYYYAAAHFGSRQRRSLNMVLCLAVPIVLHGVYDALLMVQDAGEFGILIFVWLVFCIVMFRVGVRRIGKMRTPAVPQRGIPMPPPVPVEHAPELPDVPVESDDDSQSPPPIPQDQ